MVLDKVCGFIAFSLWTILFTGNINIIYGDAAQCPIKPQPSLHQYIQDYSECEPPPRTDCDPKSVYYSLDGSCNNLKYPNWGRAGSPLQSILPQAYADNYNAPRKMKNGEEMPWPRVLSYNIFPDKSQYDASRNSLYYGFSQFLTHDISRQIRVKTEKPCCENGQPSAEMPDVCNPCYVPKDDPFYSRVSPAITCLENTRTIDTKHRNCSGNKPVQGFNHQTAWLDLSFVYGCTVHSAQKMRLDGTALLRTTNPTNSSSSHIYFDYPQVNKNCPFGRIKPNVRVGCFINADNRTNQNSELLLMHSMFMSLHNIVVGKLGPMNPEWNTEKLFQEAKRIVIAIYQHIIANELIIANIGTQVAKAYNLLAKTSGYSQNYDPNINPQVRNEMSSTVGRHGHSNVVGNFTNKGDKAVSYLLRNTYKNLTYLTDENNVGINFEKLIEMYLAVPCQRQENSVTAELSGFLFAPLYGKLGIDLTCIDLLRGRQFGEAGCNEYREYCGLPRFKNFQEIIDSSINPSAASKLSDYYSSPDDVDLYTCGLLEKPCGDSSLGPTFSCLKAEQFRWSMYGDRLWYDYPTAQFTLPQLDVIRQYSIAKLLCIVFPQLDKVPTNAFYVSSSSNPLVDCSSLRKIDFSTWKQN